MWFSYWQDSETGKLRHFLDVFFGWGHFPRLYGTIYLLVDTFSIFFLHSNESFTKQIIGSLPDSQLPKCGGRTQRSQHGSQLECKKHH